MAWESTFCQQMMEMTLSEEDVEELRSERTIKNNKVTKEELLQLTVDENLNPVDRIEYLFKNGQSIQKLSAVNSLYDVFKKEPDKTRTQILPLFENELLLTSSKDILLASAKFLLLITNERLLDGDEFSLLFLDHIFDKLSHTDKEICDLWLQVLVSSFDILPKTHINGHVLKFLQSNGSLSQGVQTRRACCKIISHLAKHVDNNKLLSHLIPKMKLLCQDIELDIRSCMCYELEMIIKQVGKDITKDYILPKLCLLFQDEETLVQQAGLSTISNILSTMDPDILTDYSLIHLIIKFYTRTLARKRSEDMIIAAQYIGPVLYSLSGYLSENQIHFMLDCFQILCVQGATEKYNVVEPTSHKKLYVNNITPLHKEPGAECRNWCAHNFPGILMSIPLSSFNSFLLPSYLYLITDNHPAVRKTMTCSLHEVAKILSKDVHLIYNSIKTSLKDTDPDVLDGLISGLPETLEVLSYQKAGSVADLIPTILSCEVYLSKSLRWRTHEKLLRNLSCLHKYLTTEQIYYKFIPVLFGVLNANKVLPVKHAAGYSLLVFIKFNRKLDERRELCDRMITGLARSESSKSRLLFFDLCYYVAELFSKRFFKETFYDVVMEMAVDANVNVRIKFCKTLHLLKSEIKLPCDRLLLQMLEQTVRRIMALENDRDVSIAIRQAIIELDSVRLSMEGTKLTEDDLADREKEKGEEKIVEESIERREAELLVANSRVRSQSLGDPPKKERFRNCSVGSKEKKTQLKAGKPLVPSSKKSGTSSKSKDSCTTTKSKDACTATKSKDVCPTAKSSSTPSLKSLQSNSGSKGLQSSSSLKTQASSGAKNTAKKSSSHATTTKKTQK